MCVRVCVRWCTEYHISNSFLDCVSKARREREENILKGHKRPSFISSDVRGSSSLPPR